MNEFSRIKTVLDDLANTAKKLDVQRGVQPRALFDDKLFRCRSRLLSPCVQEALATFKTILGKNESYINGEKALTPRQAEYLTEQLLDQISAISREISTNLRPGNASTQRLSLKRLQQNLIQHQEWEHRLRTLVDEKQNIVNTAATEDKHAADVVFNTARDRLIRCQHSREEIEEQIAKLKDFT
ncbi:primosomal replication protein [Vibrio sp. DW001]|uniref:primosomal replication protein n=1 Tax=Vibrio sp. DW001 TaxID=2912315 RepID=UPI0023B0CDA9|nr:primosomal replication protein [Vibrio sp. DW001]WED25586.1 primosomal replication protein [Vibrio sp. DW001]